MCPWSGSKRVVEAWRHSFHLLLSVFEVDVLPLPLYCGFLPFFVCPWAVQALAVFIEVVGEAVGEFSQAKGVVSSVSRLQS